MADRIHMGGLLSEVDTQGIIDQLLALEVAKINKVRQEQVALEADVAAWADIGGAAGNLTDALDTLRSYDTWSQMTATSSDPSTVTALADPDAMAHTYRIAVTRLAQAHCVASLNVATGYTPAHDADDNLTDDPDGAGPQTALLTAGHQFTIEGETVTIASGETLQSLRTKINDAAASMDEEDRVQAVILDNRLVITRLHTGSAEIQMADVGAGTALQKLELWNGSAYGHELVEAQTARFTVDNALVERDSNTQLTDVIEDVTLNLVDDMDPGDEIQLTIARDTETAKNAILDFIEKYNTLIERIDAYDYVETDGSDTPATGILQGDFLTRGIRTQMRRLATDSKSPELNAGNAAYVYGGRTGVMESLEDIGIWTTGKENVLELDDEDRLDAMLANEFEKVEQLFRGVFVPGSGYANGVAEDLYDYAYRLTSPVDGQILSKTVSIETSIDQTETRIDRMLTDLDTYENQLWNEFTAMEDSIAAMQSELSWLTSQLGIK